MSSASTLHEESRAQTASFLLVSGAPGSGKTTLARQLAQILGFPLLSKDVIKESLFDSLGATLGPSRTPAELSRLLSDAAMELLWSLAPHSPQIILEANFRPKSEYERGRIYALAGRKLEIYCHCSPQEAARRFAERAQRAEHHAAHSMKTFSLDLLAEYDRPVGLCPVVDIDTENTVSVQMVVDQVREHWPDQSD